MPTPRYAADTAVPVDRTRTEIERLLGKYESTGFGYLSQGDAQVIVFEIGRRQVYMQLPMPDRADREFTHTPTGRLRSVTEAGRAYDQAVRARWRALLLIIKAKMEAVNAGVTTIEREFLADIALPNGQTVGQFLAPQLQAAYGGEMPALLPGPR